MHRHILIVDDEPNILNSLERLLREEDYCVYKAKGAEEGMVVLEQTPAIGVILSDQRMPRITGIEFLRQIKSHFPDKARMILSGYSELQTLTEAINEVSVFKFVCKPWDDEQLLHVIAEAFEYHELSERNRTLSLELIETNRKLEQLNSALEDKIEEKTRHLKLHIASLKVHHETLEHFPFAVMGLDSSLTVVLENAQSRNLLTHGNSSALGLDIKDALDHSYHHLIPEFETMLATKGQHSCVHLQDASRIEIYSIGSTLESIGLLLIAIPAIPRNEG